MATSHKVLVILSTVRDGRHGAKVGQAVMKHLASMSNLHAEILGTYLLTKLISETRQEGADSICNIDFLPIFLMNFLKKIRFFVVLLPNYPDKV